MTVHASPVDAEALKAWTTMSDMSLPVGIVEKNPETVRFAWGVRGLPWLILTDREHVVRADGFALTELDEKLRGVTGR